MKRHKTTAKRAKAAYLYGGMFLVGAAMFTAGLITVTITLQEESVVRTPIGYAGAAITFGGMFIGALSYFLAFQHRVKADTAPSEQTTLRPTTARDTPTPDTLSEPTGNTIP